ncbi:circularly permuted type 2 ATP-grasp protein [Polynucleobacter asymbioticus]|uniref:A circularly permuted ATPgrasp family protein n=1 Tax=Polynucleobacter asymbioticus TaxID=576611 RepID=A0AAC9NGJ0_9BURK|nr:circularly permuted type 2 ATP-grasp protein [Polynucleobacter asymbioticus]APB99120.1 A circularly permuted ATPgrasp family protein [Polynucleobacter asymbioticus]APC01420.1 A circularly permuted ATPgrasp family protein [Polynucleobacter asymbioticus]
MDTSQANPLKSITNPSLVDEITRLAPKASEGHFDELRGNGSELLPHWKTFFDQLEPSGLSDLDQRTLELDRQVRENGITYNVYADEFGPQRPWSVDLFPLIINTESWQEIQSGVLQRARLLEAIVQDIYGPQTLLKEGYIPPALVYGHPGYLRSMHGVKLNNRKHLHIIAFDLARAPNGKWSVLSQRTQAPSGLGYLLENRNLIARQFPAAYEAMQIAPLANAYRDLIDALKLESPAGSNAHIALLTPGPYNETYFEHAYLARYLGLTLVEGGDLTVRDQRLYLKTVRGLEPVDILLKRLDDEFLDPLELRSDSTLGVPGLMQVIRAGNVILANAPGSAFLESPALLGFLPAISEHLLGEEIQLPAMDTWWCGERAALEAAIPNLGHSAIKPTYPNGSGHQNYESALGGELSQAQLDQWVGRITRQPDEHTVQTYIPLAQMPTWLNAFNINDASLIEPHSYMLRVFALSNGADSWQVLPGGLARIAGNNSGVASMQRGGSSADVWVQTQQSNTNQENHTQQAAPNKEILLRKRMVTSRAAENLYWFGRYTERSENILRLAKLYLENINSEYTPSRSLWSWLENLCHHYGLVPDGVPSNFDQGDIRHRIFERTLVHSLNASENATSVGFNLNAMKRTASNVRERLSTEQWSTINHCIDQFEQDCHKANSFHDFSSSLAIDALKQASSSLAAITGAQTDRMTRDDGWQLLSIGRHIERLSFLTTVLDSAIQAGLLNNPNADSSGYMALLNLFDSTITFHAQHQQSREIAPLISLLVLDDENPRSLAWVSKALRARLSKLAGTERNNPDQLTRSVTNLQDYDLYKLSSVDGYGNFFELRNCLYATSQSAWNVSDAIGARYFTLIHANEYSVQF